MKTQLMAAIIAALVTAGAPGSTLAAPTDRYKVSRIKLQGKGRKLKVRYRLTAVNVSARSTTVQVKLRIRCFHCGHWYEGESRTSAPLSSSKKSANLVTGPFSWKDRLSPTRTRTCELRWTVSRTGSTPAQVTRCRRGRRVRAGGCPTLAYNKKRCRKVRAAYRRTRLAARVSRMGMLRILGTRGRGSGGGLMASGRGVGVAKAFSGLGGLRIAGRRSRRGEGGGDAAAVPKAFRTTAKPGCYRLLSGTIDQAGATRSIRRALGGFRASYERVLRRDPTFSVGQLTVALTVLPTGKTGDVTVSPATNSSLEAGIKRYLARLRFPPPEGGEAKISFCLILRKVSTNK